MTPSHIHKKQVLTAQSFWFNLTKRIKNQHIVMQRIVSII